MALTPEQLDALNKLVKTWTKEAHRLEGQAASKAGEEALDQVKDYAVANALLACAGQLKAALRDDTDSLQ